MNKIFVFTLVSTLLLTSTVGVRSSKSAEKVAESSSATETNRDILFQASLLQALTFGDYNGNITIAELKRHGDTGLGTFEGVDGELVMLDGRAYRAAGDGSVNEVDDETTSPFASVSFFDRDKVETVSNVKDFDALRALLKERVAALGENRFYLIRIDGTFANMFVRSELRQEVRQEPPYRTLAAALKEDQTCFTYENISGTVVGVYCPPYMDMLNAPGWHLHFVSEDRTKGGHVLDLTIKSAELAWDLTDGFQVQLPAKSKAFAGFDLTVDQSKDIEKVETKAGAE